MPKIEHLLGLMCFFFITVFIRMSFCII